MKKLKLEELGRVSVAEHKASEKAPIVIVMDNVRSALNIGSAFRTADSFALERIVLCGICATPPNRDILKSALGSTESVDWIHVESNAEAVQKLKTEGYICVAIEQAEGSVSLSDFEIDTNQKYALIFGNEVDGVADEVMKLVDFCIEIPQFGTKHSLNVSVCVGILSWEFGKVFH
jgi:23S rRNA (guanosine2251-2'-O)-methyltransferase